MTLQIETFAAEDAVAAELRAWYELFVAISAEGYPSFPVPPYESYVQQLCKPVSYIGSQRHWVARDNGRLIGTATANFPTEANSVLAYIGVRVAAQDRRDGVGSRLLSAMLPQVRERGFRRASGLVRAGADGQGWTAALGFETVLQRSSHHLDIKATDPALWQVKLAPGFRLHRWTDTAPNELVQGFARARNALADQPTGESSFRTPTWTVERVRQHEARMREVGESRRYVVAVEERSGKVAGFTEIAIVPEQWSYCYQEGTGVLREYRGLGLGRAMKASMMRWLTAELPRLEQVLTTTASENHHMIRVNAQLGYKTDYTECSVEAEVSTLETRLAAFLHSRHG